MLHLARWMVSRLVGYTIGIMYPAFMSFKSLESGDAAKTGHWLTYWIVWSCITTIEVFEDSLLCWLPLYYELKLCLVLWLIHPQSHGAEKTFDLLVKPLLNKHSKRIEEGISLVEFQAEVLKTEFRKRAAAAGLGEWDAPKDEMMPGSAKDLGAAGLVRRGGGAASIAIDENDPEVATPRGSGPDQSPRADSNAFDSSMNESS